MKKHTQTPWHFEGPDEFGDYNILHKLGVWAIGAVVSNLNPPEVVAANATLIVRAVNNHHSLVEALDAAVKALRSSAGPEERMNAIRDGNTALMMAKGTDAAPSSPAVSVDPSWGDR